MSVSACTLLLLLEKNFLGNADRGQAGNPAAVLARATGSCHDLALGLRSVKRGIDDGDANPRGKMPKKYLVA